MIPASKRLSLARAKLSIITREIGEAERARRAALLADHDDAAASADRDLDRLRPAAKRVADKIELLGPLVQAEHSTQDWPDNVADARKKLETLERRQLALKARKPTDLSAVDQMELDMLAGRIPALANHLALLERMAT